MSSAVPVPSGSGAVAAGASQRNVFLDTLRGFAIVLMVVDHVAGLLMDIRIQDSYLRLSTRLAMPLFCVLMGYFFILQSRFKYRRLGEVVVAAVMANLVFYPHYHSIEILGCLVLAALLFKATGPFFVGFAVLLFAYPWDPLVTWFDFPPTIVVSFVAQGMILRRFGIAAAIASGLILSSGAFWIHELQPAGVNHKLCLFILPATLLVDLGSRFPAKHIPGLDRIGQYPLTAYVVQYYAIMLISQM
ncbi:TraX family protein [Rubripirellula reticaptiva]|uniref:TraX family protein n=1 Tax=Rubripirellula reticaptiva TaxID=2528013 RepID=UPI0016440BAF|nr:TraX family protein [Rubripirellula reticaptiva]